MAFKGMPNYTGTEPSYNALRHTGATGGTSAAGTRHLGTRHPPIRGLWPKTAGTLTGSGVPSGSLWARRSSGQLWPRR